jgi:hypothetical protein
MAWTRIALLLVVGTLLVASDPFLAADGVADFPVPAGAAGADAAGRDATGGDGAQGVAEAFVTVERSGATCFDTSDAPSENGTAPTCMVTMDPDW